MVLDKTKACFEHDTYHEADNKILRVHMEQCTFAPSIEYNEMCMSKIIDILGQVTNITYIVLSQQRHFEYDTSQVNMLNELSSLYKSLNQEERYQYNHIVLDPTHEKYLRNSYAQFQRLISKRLKEDPLSAYVHLKRLERREKIKVSTIINQNQLHSQKSFITVMDTVLKKIEQLKIIQRLLPHLKEYELDSRTIYSYVLQPTTRPDFMFTKLLSQYPIDADLEDTYTFGDDEKTEINLFSFDTSIKNLYHMTPPELKFNEDEYALLDTAKRILSEHKPTKEEFVNPERMREVFFNISSDLVKDLAKQQDLHLSEKKTHNLARALMRYTVGFGLIELLLSDPKVQDVNINSPNGTVPIYIVHEDFGDCYTNIYPTPQEVQSWATKLRLLSGRPLDEANPILDTEITTETFSSRVSAVTAPLDPFGLAFSFRRHRDHPWTIPLYMSPKIRYLNKMAAGLLSFLIDGNVTILVAGTRSSGKSSLLGAILVEIMRRYRIITIEDTLELPNHSLRELGYNLECLKVGSALSLNKGSEVDASTGIRSTLRLGDSAIFVGEVRSKEAIALYEAMRVGAAANVVAGTIHAASPYGVYDRVVNDIGVPKTSFKATDIIVVANPIRSADGKHRLKRVLRITEIRKMWEEDPMRENGFVDLMVYNPKTDELEPTKDFMNGNSDILKRIAGNIRDFAGDWDAVYNNIILRGECKQALVELSQELEDPNILEAKFVIMANDKFHLLTAKVRDSNGKIDNEKLLFKFKEFIRREAKRLND